MTDSSEAYPDENVDRLMREAAKAMGNTAEEWLPLAQQCKGMLDAYLMVGFREEVALAFTHTAMQQFIGAMLAQQQREEAAEQTKQQRGKS